MVQARKYWNQSERFGGREKCTLADIRELDPDGEYIETVSRNQPVIIDRNTGEVVATQKRNGNAG